MRSEACDKCVSLKVIRFLRADLNFVRCVLPEIDHPDIQNQILPLDAYECAIHLGRLLKVQRLNLGGVL